MNEAIKQGESSKFSNDILAGYSYQVGNIYLELDDYNNAIIFFNNAIEKDPSLTNSYNKLGICFYRIGEYEKSLDIWKKGMDNGDKNCTNNYNWLKIKLNK
jgi:tetratricopeptide (TPR) repeat protein